MVGERLRRFRLARRMSLGDLEAAIDGLVSSQTLSKYERGKLQPTARVLNQIASAFGIKSAQLWTVGSVFAAYTPRCDVHRGVLAQRRPAFFQC